MKQYYESEVLFQLMERDGFNIPSSVPPYEAEIKAYLINQVKQAYPKLTDYEAEWLLYNYTKHLPAEFPISSVSDVTEATFENVVPFAYQSAILKGNTLVNLSNYKNLECVPNMQFSLTKPNLIRGNKTYILIFTHTGANGDTFALQEYKAELGWIINHLVTLVSNTPKQYYIFTTKENTGLMKIQSTSENNYTLNNLMVLEYQNGMENWDIPYFEGMQSVKMPVLTTSNEDGTKTNILTVNEPVELRGIGEVQDTLDCLTGELTQRIDEIVLDGSEDWFRGNQDNEYTTLFAVRNIVRFDDTNTNFPAISDRYTFDTSIYGKECVTEGFFTAWSGFYVRIGRDKVSPNIEEFKQWLSQNPTTIHYELKTPVIKTVDLTTVNEKGETTYFMPLEGTMNVQSSGEIIQPTFDMTVPVEATTQNLASFIDLEMRNNHE